jgi:crotonobetainyl-CoA:carnitine CoA-transferase CaiB-like acyl-CoA transferase
MTLALEGIKVVDVSQVAAAPMAARHLADFGADVIHIEHPVRGDSFRAYQAGQGGTGGAPSDINYTWENCNRNKRSVTLDISQKGGQEIIYRLLAKADVFVTNLRPFELEEFKLEYHTLRELNPKLVYATVTAYGKEGPEKNEPGYDATAYWARAGIPYALSMPGIPCANFRTAIGDNVVALALFSGIMTALYARERTGVGQQIDVALFQAGIYVLSFDIAGALVTGQDYADWTEQPPTEMVAEAGAAVARIAAFYKTQTLNPLVAGYMTEDWRVILIVALQPDRYWPRFCQAIEHPELQNDPRFNSLQARAENREALYPILDEVFLSKTLEEWKSRLGGIPFAVTQNLVEVINDPEARANGYFVPIDHPTHGRIEVVANPINLSETPATLRMSAPEFGQHTEEVLLELGYTWEDIVQLREEEVI